MFLVFGDEPKQNAINKVVKIEERSLPPTKAGILAKSSLSILNRQQPGADRVPPLLSVSFCLRFQSFPLRVSSIGNDSADVIQHIRATLFSRQSASPGRTAFGELTSGYRRRRDSRRENRSKENNMYLVVPGN